MLPTYPLPYMKDPLNNFCESVRGRVNLIVKLYFFCLIFYIKKPSAIMNCKFSSIFNQLTANLVQYIVPKDVNMVLYVIYSK